MEGSGNFVVWAQIGKATPLEHRVVQKGETRKSKTIRRSVASRWRVLFWRPIDPLACILAHLCLSHAWVFCASSKRDFGWGNPHTVSNGTGLYGCVADFWSKKYRRWVLYSAPVFISCVRYYGATAEFLNRLVRGTRLSILTVAVNGHSDDLSWTDRIVHSTRTTTASWTT